jgi:hypothetical protein
MLRLFVNVNCHYMTLFILLLHTFERKQIFIYFRDHKTKTCWNIHVMWGLIKRKIKKYHTIGTTTKSNVKIVNRGKVNITYTQVHNCGLSPLGSGTSIRIRRVDTAFWTETSRLIEVMRSRICLFSFLLIVREQSLSVKHYTLDIIFCLIFWVVLNALRGTWYKCRHQI